MRPQKDPGRECFQVLMADTKESGWARKEGLREDTGRGKPGSYARFHRVLREIFF